MDDDLILDAIWDSVYASEASEYERVLDQPGATSNQIIGLSSHTVRQQLLLTSTPSSLTASIGHQWIYTLFCDYQRYICRPIIDFKLLLFHVS